MFDKGFQDGVRNRKERKTLIRLRSGMRQKVLRSEKKSKRYRNREKLLKSH